jgi:hypothetical protein
MTSLIDSVEFFVADTPPRTPLEEQMRQALSSTLLAGGARGVLAFGVNFSDLFDAIAILNSGIAAIRFLQEDEQDFPEITVQNFQQIVETSVNQPIFVHRLLVLPVTQIDVEPFTPGRMDMIGVCSADQLADVLLNLGDSCNASLVATLYPLLSKQCSEDLLQLIQREPQRFGTVEDAIPWLQAPFETQVSPTQSVLPEPAQPEAPLQTLPVSEPPSPAVASAQPVPTGHSVPLPPAAPPTAEQSRSSSAGNPSVSITSWMSQASAPPVAVLEPQQTPSDIPIAEEILHEPLGQAFPGILKVEEDPKLSSRFLKPAGLVLLVGISAYQFLFPAAPVADPKLAPKPEVVVAERTEQLLKDLDTDAPVPMNQLTPRLADALLNEYALGIRSLWNPGKSPIITSRQTAMSADQRTIQVALGFTFSDTTTHIVQSVWRKIDQSWFLDDWQVATAPTIGNPQPELPGAKLKCRRDNLLPPPEAGLLKLYELQGFERQGSLSEATFRNLYATINSQTIDPNATQAYYSTSFSQFVAKNPSNLTALRANREAHLHFGPSLWPGKPVYWFRIQPPYLNQSTNGIAAFKIQSGQVVIDWLEVACRN